MKFNGGKRSFAQATTLALTAGLLAVLGIGVHGPASAEIACRETFAGPASGIQAKAQGTGDAWAGASKIQVPIARTVAKLRLTLDVIHPDATNLHFFLLPPNSLNFNPRSELIKTSTTGALNGVYTFDDASATSIVGANKPQGLYSPATPLGNLTGRATQGEWVLWINNFGGPGGQLRAVSLTVTYADCPDANGDGLHDDADADGVVTPTDNCPDLANGDQLDSDADGLGNACDESPYPPPLPPVGQPGPREVSLKYVEDLHRFKGAVASPIASCERTDVVLWKRIKGDDRRLSVVRPSATGKFRTGKVRKPGRYYATVAAALVDLSAVECVAKTSRTVKLRR